jgi:hypothetical protein
VHPMRADANQDLAEDGRFWTGVLHLLV